MNTQSEPSWAKFVYYYRMWRANIHLAKAVNYLAKAEPHNKQLSDAMFHVVQVMQSLHDEWPGTHPFNSE